MRILHISASYKPAYVYGGPVFSVAELCEALVRHGHEVTVLSTLANGNTELQIRSGTIHNVNGVNVQYFKRITKDHSQFSPALLVRLMRIGKSYDVIHIHSWWNLCAVLAALICALFRWNFVLTPRGALSYLRERSIVKKVFQQVIGKPILSRSLVQFTSELEQKNSLLALQPNTKQVIIPNIVTLWSGIVEDVPRDCFTMGFLSRIHPHKNLELLFETLKDFRHPFKLRIAGTGQPEYISFLQQIAKDYNIDKQVSWENWQEDHAKHQFLNSLDVLVLPSNSENFANTVAEALGIGTGVLVSEGVGLSDFVQKHDVGWVFKLEKEDLLKKLNQCYQDEQKREIIREKAPQVIKHEFNSKAVVQHFVQVYTQNNAKK